MATMTRRREGGQILVLFTLAAVAVIAMVGLVLDGGSTFAQRRDQQNATDAAALAAANTYLLTTSETQATAAATSTAAANGFTDGNDGTSISVAYDYTSGVMVSVGIQALHPNAFTPVVGIDAWTVSTTSTAQAGFPDMAYQATPFMGSIHVFDNNGDPLPQYSDPDNPFAFNDSNGDVPQDVSDIAWTNYGTGNLDTTTVENMIKGSQPQRVGGSTKWAVGPDVVAKDTLNALLKRKRQVVTPGFYWIFIKLYENAPWLVERSIKRGLKPTAQVLAEAAAKKGN